MALKDSLKVGLVTKEWPPQVYGGAGVHVVQLSQALSKQPGIQVDVHCFGGARPDAFGYETPVADRKSTRLNSSH